MRDIYELYLSCFPEYPVSYKVFQEVQQPEKAKIFRCEENGELVGFAMVHGASISLLCVREDRRKQGFGSELLRKAEEYIGKTAAKITLGQGSHYLLQGVPESEENLSFFSKRGYSAQWTSVNMSLELSDYDPDSLDIPPVPDGAVFRFIRPGEGEALLAAVRDAHASWLKVYETCIDPIFVAEYMGEIVGFQILAPKGGRFAAANDKVGAIGCVGVVHRCRNKGLGRRMVAEGAKWLKEQNCSSIELRYVELVEWYEKLGFKVLRRQWMGEKNLNNERMRT